MTTTPISLEIVERKGLRSFANGEQWQHNAYTVRLSRDKQSMDVDWHQGIGIEQDPDAATVLDSLLSDAATYLNARSFEEWAEDLGYDSDSRKAEQIYRQIEVQVGQLEDLLGNDFQTAVFPEGDEDTESVSRRLTQDASAV